MKPTLDWYFDFISPFSYLQSTRLERLGARADVCPRPLLFAGLLVHWGSVGPAEMPTKRTWTLEHCSWLAHRHQIKFRLPPEHPFNPLPLLRLALALGEDGVAPAAVVARLFQFVWVDAHLPGDAAAWSALLAELQVAPEAIDAAHVKEALRANGQRAIDAGVFGVPTAVVGGQCFWGFDSTEMLEASLDGDEFFASEAFTTARTLPEGRQRRRAPS